MNEPHGTVAGYKRGGCRLDCCRTAQMVYMKKWRMGQLDRLIDATGTRRRIQALMAIGYSHALLGRHLGRSRNYTHEIMTPDIHVTETTAATIAELYDRLCMTPATGPYTLRTRLHAARAGYAPPLAWDDIDTDPEPATGEPVDVDPVVVDRILAGETVPATRTERREVVRRWMLDGRPINELARQTGWRPERYYTRSEAVA